MFINICTFSTGNVYHFYMISLQLLNLLVLGTGQDLLACPNCKNIKLSNILSLLFNFIKFKYIVIQKRVIQ